MAMLTIHPSELLVEGPYDAEKIVRFAVINNLPKNQVFKIKSTKPDRIGISPHCGFIRALDRIEVLVTLAGRNCVDPMIRNKEKFLIQSAVTSVPSSVWQTSDPKEILRNVESHYIGESKLLMRFLPSPALPISPALPTPTERAGNEFHNGLLGDKNGILLDDSQFSTSPEQHVNSPPSPVNNFPSETKKNYEEDILTKELRDRVSALEAILPKCTPPPDDHEKDKSKNWTYLPACFVAGALVGFTVAKTV